MDSSFVLSDNSPAIYKIRFEKPSELSIIYTDVILPGVKLDDVYSEFCRYVVNNIEPVGWYAIWRTTHLSRKYEFKVEVIDVAHDALQVDVVFIDLLWPRREELTQTEVDEIDSLLRHTKVTQAPLVQLYVISENDLDEDYYETAKIIEYIRFFYSNLWRPWDDRDLTTPSGSDTFVDTRLPQRFDLLYDIRDKILPESTIDKIKRALKEAWEIKSKIDILCHKIGNDVLSDKTGDVNTNSGFIDGDDMYECLRLKLRFEDIEREVKLLEDKHMRGIVANMKRYIE